MNADRTIRDVRDLGLLAARIFAEHREFLGCPRLTVVRSLLGDVLRVGDDYFIDGDPDSGWTVERYCPDLNPTAELLERYAEPTDALRAALAMAHEDWLDRRIAAVLERGQADG
jgi:hypothetical protein